jgi:alkanesulfonate monooxygenase SsuD/methylene tetrahydromethanopterin reductase-like flavin-dependent oxidoreductase (luciferase family)
MWSEEEAVFEGEYYQIRGAINQPKGVQKPHIPLLIAGGGEQVTLKLVAQYGDVCHIGGDVAKIQHKLAILKQHCETLGRDYESIHRIASAFCSIGETYEQAMTKIPKAFSGFLKQVGIPTLLGNPASIREGLAALEATGIQEVLLLFPDALHLDSLHRFADAFI